MGFFYWGLNNYKCSREILKGYKTHWHADAAKKKSC